MANARDQLIASLPVRDFLLYVTSNRALVEVVQEATDFSLHVWSVMESRPVDPTEDFQSSSLGRLSEKTRREADNGFPLLYANSLIGLWGAFEACLDDLCLLFLQCVSRERLSNALSSARVKIGEYLALDDDDRWRWLLAQLQKAETTSLRTGVGQFESYLKPLGISPQIESGVRTTLFKIKAMRNLYAHRAGRADRKFLEEWPDHPAGIDQLVVPTNNQLLAAHTAMVMYVESIHRCVLSELGEQPPEISLPPWITTTQDLLPLLTPHPEVPVGAPWSHHFPTAPGD